MSGAISLELHLNTGPHGWSAGYSGREEMRTISSGFLASSLCLAGAEPGAENWLAMEVKRCCGEDMIELLLSLRVQRGRYDYGRWGNESDGRE